MKEKAQAKKTARKSPQRSTWLPKIATIAKKIGVPAAEWPGRCFEISCLIVNAGIVKGQAVYGHFLGEVHPSSMFATRARIGFVRHGWILADDGRVIDPTRWVFERKAPYLFAKLDRTGEYDEGGNRMRHRIEVEPPAYSDDGKVYVIEKDETSPVVWQFVKQIFKNTAHPMLISRNQMFWLANIAYDEIGEFAYDLYAMISKIASEALIPIDNMRRAEREHASRRKNCVKGKET